MVSEKAEAEKQERRACLVHEDTRVQRLTLQHRIEQLLNRKTPAAIRIEISRKKRTDEKKLWIIPAANVLQYLRLDNTQAQNLQQENVSIIWYINNDKTSEIVKELEERT